MAKLWEQVAAGDMPAVQEYVTNTLLPHLEKEGKMYLASEGRGSLRKQREVSTQLIRLVWKYMWEHQDWKTTKPLPKPYEGLYIGTLPDVVRVVCGPALSDGEITNLSYAIRKTLAHPDNRIAQIVYGQKHGAQYGIRRFDPNMPITLKRAESYEVTYDWRTEKRITEENAKPENQTVKVVIGELQIPTPDPTPEGMAEWAKKIIPQMKALHRGMQRLQGEVDRVTAENTRLAEENRLLLDQIEKAKNDGRWEATAAEIAGLIES